MHESEYLFPHVSNHFFHLIPQSVLTWSAGLRRRTWRWRDQSACQPRYLSFSRNESQILFMYFLCKAKLCFASFLPDSAYHHQKNPLWWGIQNLGSLPDEDPQASDWPAQSVWDCQADHFHQHWAWRRGRSHHRRRINDADDSIKDLNKSCCLVVLLALLLTWS